ncbi:MAG: PQQ-binding-like beta-propeller repeat protein [Verrucomicrobiota bacterium]|nr:PQQ-binding-like beta-propeller repeat protein [Verrucomicrobiota bacterium]MDP7048860.1 PQQ-binding-like beta-propeller repeat protein [Verrucomicrobiota bacterium]
MGDTLSYRNNREQAGKVISVSGCLAKRLVLSALLVATTAVAAGDWTEFRGPLGTGHIPGGQALPTDWSESKNIDWKVALPGRAWSSPVVSGDVIWLTTADEKGHKLSALAVDAKSGKVIFEKQLFHIEKPQFAHKFNTYASPTPIIEGDRVYLTWGSPGTACLDTKTKELLWKRDDFVCDHFRGSGSSPIIYGDLLILTFDGADHQFVAALNKRTGKTVWRTDRSVDFQDLGSDGKPFRDGDMRKGYSTPLVIEHGGFTQLISIGAMACYSYEPKTGKEIWRITERAQHSASTRPVFGHGLLFYPTGFAKGQLLAVDPGAKGEAADTHIKWRLKRSVSNKPSVLLIGGLLFMIDDGGIVSSVEAKSGEVVWSERVGGNHSASPVTDGERIFFFSEEGKTTVIAAKPEYKVLATSQLDGGFMASPAVHGAAWILRTKTHLYRIANR